MVHVVTKKKFLLVALLSSVLLLFFVWNKKAPAVAPYCQLQVPLNFTKIKNCLDQHRKRFFKLEDFLAELPAAYREKFTLIHHSRSQQAASFENPRVIFFGPGLPEVILTFTAETKGQEGQEIDEAAFNNIEMISWNAEERSFEFHEIGFPYAQLSEKNPAKCFRCHGESLRPNWQHYNVWPGAYAGDDDRLSEEELGHLENLIKRAPEHPRYRWIENLAAGYRPFDYTAEEIARYKARAAHWRPTTSGMHNKAFNEGIGDLNFSRIAHQLKQLADYPRIKHFLLGLLMCQYEELHPRFWERLGMREGPWPLYEGRQTKAQRPSALRSLGLDFPLAQATGGQSLAPECLFDRGKYERGHQVLYLFLNLLMEHHGQSAQHFFMDFLEHIPFSFDIPGPFLFKFAAKLIEDDPDLAMYFDIKEVPFYSKAYTHKNKIAVALPHQGVLSSCAELAPLTVKGRRYFEQLVARGLEMCTNGKSRSPEIILRNCQSCHQDKNEFSRYDLEQIAYYISPRAGIKRMPPNRKFQLSAKEQEEFLRYLHGRAAP